MSIYLEVNNCIWSQQEIHGKLENLAKATKYQWIQKDLTLPSSSYVGRFFWSLIAKRFDCLRLSLYDVDLKVTQDHLRRIGAVIAANNADQTLVNLFNRAVVNFENITHHHYPVNISDVAGRTSNASQPVFIAPPPSYTSATSSTSIPNPIVVERPVVVEKPVVIPTPVFIPPSPPRRRFFNRNVSFASPVVTSSAPILTRDGHQIPGTSSIELGRRDVRPIPVARVVTPPRAAVPTVAGRVVPGTNAVDLGRGRGERPVFIPPSRPVVVPTVADRVAPGAHRPDVRPPIVVPQPSRMPDRDDPRRGMPTDRQTPGTRR